ncbi:unnamed protein product, partial [Brassica rapa]
NLYFVCNAQKVPSERFAQRTNDHQITKLKFVRILGKGSFGSVHLLEYTKPDGSMFYKAMKISAINRHDSLHREFQILSKLRGCPNIIQSFHKTRTLTHKK